MARERGTTARPTRQTVQRCPCGSERAVNAMAGNHHCDFLCDRFANPVALGTAKVMSVKIEVTDPVLSEFFLDGESRRVSRPFRPRAGS
jgi:hypothetical protein